MPQLPLFDRVQETTNSSGTGNLVLNGAVLGFRRFVDTIGVGNQTYYTIQNNGTGEWEVGIGTLLDSNTLARTTILSSSNNNAVVNLSVSQKQIFLSVPAQEINKDKNFLYIQSSPATIWNITHNLNKYPSIQIIDSAGSVVFGEIIHLSPNSVRLVFSAAFSGQATFN